MKIEMKRWLLLILMPMVLVLGACSDFDEIKSRKLYSQAERHLEEGQELRAEALLQQLVTHYPRTQIAIKAQRQLGQIQRQKDIRERTEFARILDSYRQVFNGYRSVYAEYPKDLNEFDTSDYFFDSAYLEEITEEGFSTYLWLTGDEKGFRVWCVKGNKELGYAADGNSRELVKFDRQDTMNSLQEKFAVVHQAGGLNVLAPRL